MFSKLKKLKMLLLIIAALTACGNSSEEIAKSSQVVAKVNDEELTTSYVERRLKRLSPLAHKALQNPKGQKEFIESLTTRELIIQAAKKENMQKAPAFVSQVQDYKKDLLIQNYIKEKLLKKQINVTEQDIQAYYDSQKANFQAQPELRISHIFVSSQVEAEEVLSQLKQGEDFTKLAMEKSANRATAIRGGDMGYVRRWQLPPAVADGVFALEVGQITEIIPSDFGYTILKVTEKRMGPDVAVADIAEAIKMNLMREKQRKALDDLVADLKKGAKISVNESVLASFNFSMGGELEVKENPPAGNATPDAESGK
ncbi:MAG: peptidyl-prolyl cis-trans isomerase [Candidatus Schekmanbacteria bacterium]|nr:peptidyl-prolyl cis-trans isomerase [Candidatus Schekmanbacteria bacterium]